MRMPLLATMAMASMMSCSFGMNAQEVSTLHVPSRTARKSYDNKQRKTKADRKSAAKMKKQAQKRNRG